MDENWSNYKNNATNALTSEENKNKTITLAL